ncbi:hypothetical protein OH76DRAFT_1409316 [Lentinus brumalis]|uniref:Uncharacterized protein n=1 Tax=Lentinus brumalis TaxID=2498619 RepID=A0A371CVA7_9APHY|nr:hypothetical protein OH76DRAFT_1409316 [Polyporus brumalis]
MGQRLSYCRGDADEGYLCFSFCLIKAFFCNELARLIFPVILFHLLLLVGAALLRYYLVAAFTPSSASSSYVRVVRRGIRAKATTQRAASEFNLPDETAATVNA